MNLTYRTPNTVLIHHGIIGQKWGVKNGPPYPLKEDQNGKSNNQYHGLVSGVALGPVGVIAASFAPIVINHFKNRHKEKSFEKMKEKVNDERNKNKVNIEEVDTISDSETLKAHAKGRLTDDDIKSINPQYWTADNDLKKQMYTFNCLDCTIATELRLRNHDCIANVGSHSVASIDTITEVFGKPVKSEVISSQDLKKNFKSVTDKFSNNSSGYMAVYLKEINNGHIIHWTKDSKGKFEIQDGQIGKRYNNFDEMIKDQDIYGYDDNLFTISQLNSKYLNTDELNSGNYIRKPNSESENYISQSFKSNHSMNLAYRIPDTVLIHHGIKGQKWGYKK